MVAFNWKLIWTDLQHYGSLYTIYYDTPWEFIYFYFEQQMMLSMILAGICC